MTIDYKGIAKTLRAEGERLLSAARILESGNQNHGGSLPGRRLSVEARKRIADAQRARWAKVRAQKGKRVPRLGKSHLARPQASAA